MREKLNSDPKAQIALIAVLAVVGAFMFMKMSGGGGEEEGAEAPTAATVSVAGTGASATATGATAGEAVESAVEGALESATAEASAVPTSIPPPPLPRPVAAAYKADKTVVLLVVHDGGIDDRLVEGTVRGLEAVPDVALFVVPAKQIARYAAITLGAEVEQVPALVTMTPRKLSGGTPQASVETGFQTPQSIVQAIVDARYKGPEATYYPE
ncbi:MAG TPA: hypothetical protein VFX85_10705 [Solirubrobacterales bacterium]|nr:hypothetical protein [Solirubrobacterales bacterium]